MYKLKISSTNLRVLPMICILLWSTIVVGNDVNLKTDVLFKKFYDAIRYIYFPGSQEILDTCYVEQEKKCIDTYKRATEAKNSIFSNGPESALDATLSAINSNCKGGKRTNDATCNGALAMLYFFNSAEYDSKILSFFSTTNIEVTQTAFETTNGYWLQTRPDKSKWIKFVNSSEAFNEANKEGHINVIKAPLDYNISLQLIRNNTAE